MNKFLRVLSTLIGIAVMIALTVFLVLKIKEDMTLEKENDVEKQNIEAESSYMLDIANEKIKSLKEEIEKDLKVNIEVADVGDLEHTDIYFVTKVDNEYKFIIKSDENNTFKIAENNDDEAKYIVSVKMIGLDNCVYTKLSNYSIDKNGVVTYLNKK